MKKFFRLPESMTVTAPEDDHARHTTVGTLQDFFASALCLPTGLLTAAFLTRQLGPRDYGLLTVAAYIVVWIEMAITLGFGRAAVKFISETEKWESVASRFLQVQLFVSLVAAAVLFAVAPILALWLDSYALTTCLRVFSLDIPITAMTGIHRSILVGRGRYGQRAVLSSVFWLSRMIFIFIFVGLSSTVTNAILASIGASVVVLTCARRFVRPALLKYSDFPFRPLWDYGWPLFLYTVGLSLFGRIDLMFVKALSKIPQAAGFYGAAKNLTIVPGLFVGAFAPLFLSKLVKLSREGEDKSAQVMAREGMRMVFLFLPFAGMAAGAADELAVAIYGYPFLPTGPILALLIFAALGTAMISINASAIIAAGRPELTFILTTPLLAAVFVAHYFLVPRFGAIAAAGATTCLAWIGAGATMAAVYSIWQVLPRPVTIIRSVLLSGLAYVLAAMWTAPGILLLLKLPVIMLFIVLAFLLAGEIGSKEFSMVRSLFSRQSMIEKMRGNT